MSKTELSDRTLFFDGDSVVPPERVIELFDKGAMNVCVTELTEDLIKYNRLVPANKQVRMKDSCRPLNFDWNIPEPYKSMDVVGYVADIWLKQEMSHTYNEAAKRSARLSQELTLYKNLHLFPVLRTIIFIINTLREKQVVWGVGRGSSVSSYVLYLIGVHDVDSVKYDLDFTEFLRAPDAE